MKKYPRILEDYPEKREIKPRGKNYMYGVFKQLRAFFNWSRRRGLLRSDPFEGFICPSEPRVLPDGAFRRQQGILPISGNRCGNETRACENPGKMRTIEKKVVILTEFVSMSNR